MPSGQQPVEQGVGHRPGLLVDLLAHEVVVAVLLGGLEVPVHRDPVGSTAVPSKPVTRTDPGSKLGHLVVLDDEEVAGQAQEAGMSEARNVGAVGRQPTRAAKLAERPR